MSIFLLNLNNLIGDNGSRLKPNRLPELNLFYKAPDIIVVGVEQSYIGGVQLDGEGNYAFYEGHYYFLTKTTTSHPNQAWVYTMTRDGWADWLTLGISIQGICSCTDNKKLIMDNLDLVENLIPEPANLIRVNLSENKNDGFTDIKISIPQNQTRVLAHYSQKDWNRFYSQLDSAKTPSNKAVHSDTLIAVAYLQPTGESPYKKGIYDKVVKVLRDIENGTTEYVPTRVNALKNIDDSLKYKFCLSPKHNSLGQYKEYIKIKAIDLSGLEYIIPQSIIGFQFKGSSKKNKHSFSNDGSKMYRELRQKTYLPYFESMTKALNLRVDNYHGYLSQYVKSKDYPNHKYYLDYIPDLNSALGANGFKQKFNDNNQPNLEDNRLLGIQLFNGVKSGNGLRYNKEEPLDHVDVLVGLTRGGAKSGGDRIPDAAPLSYFDKARVVYNSIGPEAYKSYLTESESFPSYPLASIPEDFRKHFITKKVRLAGLQTVNKGDYIGTNRDYYGAQLDEYDSSNHFSNINKHYNGGNDTQQSLDDNGIVVVYEPHTKKFKFMKLSTSRVALDLDSSDNNDIESVDYPLSKSINPETYNPTGLKHETLQFNLLEPVHKISNLFEGSQETQKDRGLKVIKQSNYPGQFRRQVGVIADLFSQVTGSNIRTKDGYNHFGYSTNFLTRNDVESDEQLYNIIFGEWEGNGAPVIDGKGIGSTGSGGGDYGTSVFEGTGAAGLVGTSLLHRSYGYHITCKDGYTKFYIGVPSRGDAPDGVRHLRELYSNLRGVNTAEETSYLESENARDLTTYIQKAEIESSLYNALGLVRNGKVIDESAHEFTQEDEYKLYDFVGTNIYVIEDKKGEIHIIFKDDTQIESRTDDIYEVDKLAYDRQTGELIDLPRQDIIDVLGQKNILRVLTADFDLNDRIIGDNLDGRGPNSRPRIFVRRYQPVDKQSPLEHFIISYQGPRGLLDVKMQFAKENLSGVDYDPLAAETLKFNLQKGSEDFKERESLKRAELERKRLKSQESIQKNAFEGVGAVGSLIKGIAGEAGNIALNTVAKGPAAGAGIAALTATAKIGGQLFDSFGSAGQRAIETSGLYRDAALASRQIAYSKFQLSQEHHWKNQEFAFNMAKLSMNFNMGEVNDRDIVREYSEMYKVDDIFLLHYYPTRIQKRLATEKFNYYGVNCFIPDVTLHIKEGMDAGIWEFAEVNVIKNVFMTEERTLISSLFKNGIRIIDGRQSVKDVQEIERRYIPSGAERAGEVISQAKPEQRKILLQSILNAVDADTALAYIKDRFVKESEVISTLSSLIPDKSKILHAIKEELKTEDLYPVLKAVNKVDDIINLEISHNQNGISEKVLKNENLINLLINNSEGKLAKPDALKEEAKTDIEGVLNRVNYLREFQTKINSQELVFDNSTGGYEAGLKFIVETESSSQFGDTYGKRDYVVIYGEKEHQCGTTFPFYPNIAVTYSYNQKLMMITFDDNTNYGNYRRTQDSTVPFTKENKGFSDVISNLRERDFYSVSRKFRSVVVPDRMYELPVYNSGVSRFTNLKSNTVFLALNKTTRNLEGKDSEVEDENLIYIKTKEEWKKYIIDFEDIMDKYKPNGLKLPS